MLEQLHYIAQMLSISSIHSPIGTLQVIQENQILVGLLKRDSLKEACSWFENKAKTSFAWSDKPKSDNIHSKIHAYFSGQLDQLEDIPYKWLLGTAFQQSVWEAMVKVKAGELATYGDIAKIINNPKAAQAVGMACHNNPILLKVPCHRIIGKNNQLTGFAIGLPIKQWLIEHEQGFYQLC